MQQPEFIGPPAATLKFFVDTHMNGKADDNAIRLFLAGTALELANASAIVLEVLKAKTEVLESNEVAQGVLLDLARRMRQRSQDWNTLVVSLLDETLTSS